MACAIAILCRGPGWLVVDKPSGLLSAPGKRIGDSVVTRLQAQGVAAQAVHRLDMDTSGLLVVATDQAIHRRLSDQFQRHAVRKGYVARLTRMVGADAGRIALSFRLDPVDRPRQIFDPVHGRLGVTTFEVLSRADGQTRVRFWPTTGRTHQLRLHAAHPLGLDAPILGDSLYGTAGGRLALDADRLAFVCPTEGVWRHFRRPSSV